MRMKLNGAMLALLLAASTATPVLARGNDLIFTTGKGEEVQIRNGWFGRKTKVVKDRLGNKYESKTGLFGSKDTQVSVLGNSYKQKKGLFGGSDIQGSTIFGDRVTTKKGIFGRRTTTIDASGVTSLVQSLLKDKDGQPLTGKGLLNKLTGDNPTPTQSQMTPQSTDSGVLTPDYSAPPIGSPANTF